jgi:hypothetical protein
MIMNISLEPNDYSIFENLNTKRNFEPLDPTRSLQVEIDGSKFLGSQKEIYNI